MESALFWACGGTMLLGGILMVTSRNAVVAACWLILSFLAAAGIFALLAAPFLAILQILIYAGAIMVLFLFVIMMLHGPTLDAEQNHALPRGWPLLVLPPTVIGLAGFAWLRSVPGPTLRAHLPEGFGGAERVANLLLNDYLLAFELISVVLLVAIIGALALGRVERRPTWKSR
ncbi:MAG: NADH-quinone oxidoreductase subunit J [bacterium]